MSAEARIYFRPEHGDASFIAALPRPAPFDAAIVPARYLAPYPALDSQADPDGLAAALERRSIHYLIDPGTPELCMPSFDRRASDRHKQSPIASALPGRLSVKRLLDEGARNHFGDVVLSTQTRASALAPAHLELQVRDQGELEVNLSMLERARRSTPNKRVVAIVQCITGAFRSGALTRVAPYYADAGAEHVFLRVRSIKHDEMLLPDFTCYLEAIEAFARQGIEVTIDCAGRSGPALIAGGARGFSSGWIHFHSVARRPFGGGGGGGTPGCYEVPGAFREVAADLAEVFAGLCSFEGCAAHLRSASNFQRRLHFFHVMREEADHAALAGFGYSSRLLRAGGYASAWGSALAEATSRAA